jgi:Uncharacterized conserved protein
MKKVKLIYCAPGDAENSDHNKFYEMIPDASGNSWTANWGRVGHAPQTQSYPAHEFEKKHREKLKKGYKDITSLCEVKVVQSCILPIKDSFVAKFIGYLQDYSNVAIAQNYSVTADQVSPKQVAEAQTLIAQLSDLPNGTGLNSNKITIANDLLIQLFTVIPRKMKKVADHLLTPKITRDEFMRSLDSEQSILDAMGSQAIMNAKQKVDPKMKGKTVLDVLGITAQQASPSEIEYIKKLMGPNAHQFVSAIKVNHPASREPLNQFAKGIKVPNIKSLFHGSRSENWLSILNMGLVLRPTTAQISGKMFGYGTYMADKCQKAIGYSSLRGSYWTGGNAPQGFVALFSVLLGNSLHVKNMKAGCAS